MGHMLKSKSKKSQSQISPPRPTSATEIKDFGGPSA